MARIKGKWVGQVTVDYETADMTEWGENVCKELLKNTLETIWSDLKSEIENNLFVGSTVTVTQLHADLYRDEPGEWTKEEAP